METVLYIWLFGWVIVTWGIVDAYLAKYPAAPPRAFGICVGGALYLFFMWPVAAVGFVKRITLEVL